MPTPERNIARTQLIELMLQGLSFQKAAVQVAPTIKQAMAYRLTERVRTEGEQALVDGRHGHPFKVRGEILDFIRERCASNPLLLSPTLQHELLQRFDCLISTSQLNRVRARFGGYVRYQFAVNHRWEFPFNRAINDPFLSKLKMTC